MPLDLPLRCRCGRMRGVASDVSPSTGFRLVCYCKDCQAFARFLKGADVLDPAGGMDIFQMPPGRMKLTAGTEAMRCLRLSSKVLRWYTDCCRTPIANTAAGPGFPVIGVVHSFMDHVGSWLAAALVVTFSLPFLLYRAITEDQFLQVELAGYSDYAARVRWRLLPGIW
jgi:hypothetical protein